MRRLESHPTPDKNSMQYVWLAVPLWRVARNFLVIYLCRFLPSLGLKNFFYRLIGVKIGRDVSIGLGAIIDVFWPELITIGDNTIVGFNSTILAHEFLTKQYRTGPVVIGRDVMIGANSTILAGVVIGDGAVVSAMSLVNRDVRPGAMVIGVPAGEVRGPESSPAGAANAGAASTVGKGLV